jgi:hypothetical protein
MNDDWIDRDISEMEADPFDPPDELVRIHNPGLWTPEQRRRAGLPPLPDDQGPRLPPAWEAGWASVKRQG